MTFRSCTSACALSRSEGLAECGGEAAAPRGARSAQAAPATDPHRGGAAPQPLGHPSQKPHSGAAGESYPEAGLAVIASLNPSFVIIVAGL